MATNSDEFYQNLTFNSKMKIAIVSKYYVKWAKILLTKYNHIAYIDLFAGAGKYDDGELGTALSIIEEIIKDKEQLKCVETIFNDKHKKSIEKLSGCVDSYCKLYDFSFYPKFFSEQVCDNNIDVLLTNANVPSLLFLDPWGYKGLSLDTIKRGIENRGCDCFFFFNYDAIIRSLGDNNEHLLDNLMLLFGNDAICLNEMVRDKDPYLKNEAIISKFEEKVRNLIPEVYVSTFKFYSDKSNKVSHYLFHVTKHERGFEAFKQVIKQLNKDDNGFPMYEYDPKVADSPILLATTDNLEKLAHDLHCYYKGQVMGVKHIFEDYVAKSLFLPSDARKSLMYLEDHFKISIERFNKNGERRNGKSITESDLIKFL